MNFSSEHVDEYAPDMPTDHAKAKNRRSRLRILFEEFQHEIDFLEEKLERCLAENEKLKSEKDDLRQQLDSRVTMSVKAASEAMDGGKMNSELNSSGDISTIIKLSNKLQEMIQVNENMMRVNTALRKDLQSLTKERELHFQDLAQQKGDRKVPRPLQSYHGQNFMTLDSNMSNYKYDIDRWKNAVKLADNPLGRFVDDINKSKMVESMNHTGMPMGMQHSNDLSRTTVTTNPATLPSPHHSESRANSAVTNNSAKEALQILVSRVDSTQNESSVTETRAGDASVTEKIPRDSIYDGCSQTTSPSKQGNIDTSILPTNSSEELFSNPLRFPACVKLLELTKARQGDGSLKPGSPNNIPSDTGNETPSSLPSDYHDNSSFQSNAMPFSSVPCSISSSSQHRVFSSVEERQNKSEIEDDITIVLPSSDHSLGNQMSQPPDGRRDQEFYHLSSNLVGDSRLHSRMDSEPFIGDRADVKNGGAVTSGMTNYPYYPTNAYSHSFRPPPKKVKVEDMYK